MNFLLVCLICVLRTWLGNHQIGGPKTMARQKCGLHSICIQGLTDYCQLSVELFEPFLLLVTFGGTFESWEISIFCTLFGDISCIQEVV